MAIPTFVSGPVAMIVIFSGDAISICAIHSCARNFSISRLALGNSILAIPLDPWTCEPEAKRPKMGLLEPFATGISGLP